MDSGITVRGDASEAGLQVWLASTLPGFCRLTGDRAQAGPLHLPEDTDAAALVTDGSPAHLVQRRADDGTTGTPRREFGVHAFGPDAKAAADTLATSLLAWDRAYRDGPGPVLTVHPRATHTRHPTRARSPRRGTRCGHGTGPRPTEASAPIEATV
ncbi:hypothetical protein OS965_36250 [Streptomyces sp. H27-G5]|uniref:hypothetical protein n=1 Tax=Streptomyces sp. H27-G5 TaxID=2996698 RepID=UPI0022709965|nr:hypothetical protein [Streptomyces sp. H27-G5]MCY0923531.1 hypothetical protein [Streptomyces sp. H27-G5]